MLLPSKMTVHALTVPKKPCSGPGCRPPVAGSADRVSCVVLPVAVHRRPPLPALLAGTDPSGEVRPCRELQGAGRKPLPLCSGLWGWHGLCYPLGTPSLTHRLGREFVAFRFPRGLPHCESSYSTGRGAHVRVLQPSKSSKEWEIIISRVGTLWN